MRREHFVLMCGYLFVSQFYGIRATDIRQLLDLAQNYSVQNLYLPESKNNQTECVTALETFYLDLSQGKIWALKFSDSQAGPVNGVQNGRTRYFGNYDGCIITKHETNKKMFKEGYISGQYCYLTVQQTPSTRVGLCIPTQCNASQAKSFIFGDNQLENFDVKCEIENHLPSFTALHHISLLILCVSVAFTIIAAIRYISRTKRIRENHCIGLLSQVIDSYEPFTNLAETFRLPRSVNTMLFINGLRAIATVWVQICHTFEEVSKSLVNNNRVINRTYNNAWTIQFIENGALSVDVFFLISGFLVSQASLSLMKKARISWSVVFMHRLFRLWPTMIVVTAIAILIPYIGRGPLWDEYVCEYFCRCDTEWWKPLLFISNYHTPDWCNSQMWYLAVDSQLYLLAPILLIVFHRNAILGHILNGFLILVGSAYIVVVFYTNAIPYPTIGMYLRKYFIPQKQAFQYQLYYNPLTYLAPYCIGLAVGHISVNYYVQINKILRHPLHKLIGWVCGLYLLTTALLGTHFWNNFVQESFTQYDVLHTAVFAAFAKIAWSLGLGWIIVSCLFGYGGVVNDFLSWPGFAPLSRLSYAAYLVHYPFMKAIFGAQRQVFVPDLFPVLKMAAFISVIAFSLATLLNIIVALPFTKVEKKYLEGRKLRRRRESKTKTIADSV